MKLRTRLVVAFLLLSVVPLGAVTFYTYTSNVKALQDAAEREADLLAGELSQRMQLVTAQLSERVGHLMDMPQTPEPVVRVADTKPVPAAQTETAQTETVDSNQLRDQVADSLGELAVLFNNVELPGVRAGGRGGRQGQRPGEPPPGDAGAARGRSGFGSSGGRGASATRGATPTTPQPGATTTPTPSATPALPAQSQTSTTSAATPPMTPQTTPPAQEPGRGPTRFPGDRPDVPRLRPAPGGDLTHAGSPPAPPATPQVSIVAGDRIRIDTSQIWRETLRKIVPEGQTGPPTAEQMQRLQREVTQRVQGIREGLKLSAAELQRMADEARKKAEADQKSAELGTKAATAGAKTAAAITGAITGAMKPAPAPDATRGKAAPAAATMTKKSALSGNRLDVTMMQDGQVVRAVNAEINLPNVLMTVFAAVGREKGEVPFAVGKDGQVYATTDEDRQKVQALGAVAKPDGPLGKTTLADWVVVTTADPSGSGLRFGIARPVGDSLSALRKATGRNAGLGLLFIGLAIAIVVPLSSGLTRNLSTLTEGVRRIAHGDYGARVTVKAGGEVGDLARAFNQMAEDVEKHQRAIVGQERLKRELELGRQIQHDMLPHEPLTFGLTEISGVSVPAREVGGDFFNYFALPSGHVALLVGDVSGKGVGAALLMANIQASLRTRFALGQDLSAIANAIDRDIEDNSPGPMYATLFLGILDPAARELSYVNAGHHPQFVLRRQGGLERLTSTGLPVGLLAGRGYKERKIQLETGDLVFFYTDGCVETESESGDMFGTERLEACIAQAGTGRPEDILQRTERALQEFRGARELYDDATMMAVRIG